MSDYIRITTYLWERPQSEIDQILSFYDDHRDEGNRVRDAEELIKAGRTGGVYRVSNSADGKIGVACIFHHQNGAHEAGGTRIIRNGLGLQKVLHKCRLLHAFLLDTPEREYFTIIDDANPRSISGTEKCGFDAWSPDTGFRIVVGKKNAPEKLFFTFDLQSELKREVLARHAQDLLDLHNGTPILSKDGSKVLVVLDFPLFTNPSLLKTVERLALPEDNLDR